MYSLPRPVEKLIEEFEKLPGVGPKSAARMTYHFLRSSDDTVANLTEALQDIKGKIQLCEKCFNVSEGPLCSICEDNNREEMKLCIVEESLDLLAFERSGGFDGVYFVLGGVISPVNGIGPNELRITKLLARIKSDIERLDPDNYEIIFALNPTMEGEATTLYIISQIKKFTNDIKITKLARGLPTGADLEYADNVTLKKAIEGRVGV